MAITTIKPRELQGILDSGRRVQLIDVRTPVEFAEVHASWAVSMPLDRLDPSAVRAGCENGEPVYVICKSGSRGAKACQKLIDAGLANVVNVEGGTSAWMEAGLPVARDESGRKVMSLERQVRIAAGLMVLISASLGWLVHPGFFGLCALVGAGLVFAGMTDFCGMGLLLARMPWNQNVSISCKSR